MWGRSRGIVYYMTDNTVANLLSVVVSGHQKNEGRRAAKTVTVCASCAESMQTFENWPSQNMRFSGRHPFKRQLIGHSNVFLMRGSLGNFLGSAMQRSRCLSPLNFFLYKHEFHYTVIRTSNDPKTGPGGTKTPLKCVDSHSVINKFWGHYNVSHIE